MMDSGNKRSAGSRDDISPPPSRKRKLQSNTTKEAVSSFFTPVSHKNSGTITWSTINSTLLVAHFQPGPDSDDRSPREKRRKIAAFDFDSTLIRPASGNKYSKDADDWMWWRPNVPVELRKLDSQGYQVVILSNQSGINLQKQSNTAKMDLKRLTEFKNKVASVLKQLDVSLSFYVATERDEYRKPRTGMWRELLEYFDLDDASNGVDLESCMFVGDAGGRTQGHDEADDKDIYNQDFSSSDLDFASNIGIKFQSPDEFFLGKLPRPFKRLFDPQRYIDVDKAVAPFVKTNEQDIVCLAGSPGAGKSTFYWNSLAPLGYERVNQDQLKTRDKCLKVATELLESGKSIVIDNTNADPETRAHWVSLAQRLKVPIRCICITSDAKLCEHNDAVRAGNGKLMNPENRARLPFLAFASFAKRFRQPMLEEGFQDITMVDFRFSGTPEQQAAWAQYYV